MDWAKDLSADRCLWLVNGKDAVPGGDRHGVQQPDKVRCEREADKYPVKLFHCNAEGHILGEYIKDVQKVAW